MSQASIINGVNTAEAMRSDQNIRNIQVQIWMMRIHQMIIETR
jgi:hypothetical protein